MKHTRHVLGCGLLILALAVLGACDSKPKTVYQVWEGQKILAFGDSLTQGVGARASEAYPQQLAQLTGWSIVNAGVSGETTGEGLDRLPAVLDEIEPDVVLLCLGGNDMLRKRSIAQMKQNLRDMLALIAAADAQAILIAVPEPTLLGLSDHPAYRELADSTGVPLIEGVMSSTIKESKWRADRIHPNAAGYARIAELLAAALGYRE